MSKRRIFEFVFAIGFVALVVVLLTPVQQRWEWAFAGGSLIVILICVRALSRLATIEKHGERLDRPDREI